MAAEQQLRCASLLPSRAWRICSAVPPPASLSGLMTGRGFRGASRRSAGRRPCRRSIDKQLREHTRSTCTSLRIGQICRRRTSMVQPRPAAGAHLVGPLQPLQPMLQPRPGIAVLQPSVGLGLRRRRPGGWEPSSSSDKPTVWSLRTCEVEMELAVNLHDHMFIRNTRDAQADRDVELRQDGETVSLLGHGGPVSETRVQREHYERYSYCSSWLHVNLPAGRSAFPLCLLPFTALISSQLGRVYSSHVSFSPSGLSRPPRRAGYTSALAPRLAPLLPCLVPSIRDDQLSL